MTALLPESLAKASGHLDLGLVGTGLLISDTHIPFHDVVTVELAIKKAVDEKVKWLILNGDIADFHAISRFDKRAGDPDYADELELVKQFLAYVRYKLPKAEIVYKTGNHEERLAVYVYRRAPELLRVKALKIAGLLDLDAQRMRLVDDRQVMKVGKYLHVLHGHEYTFSMSNPVNPARGLFLRGKDIGICGHFHQTSEHTEPTLGGTQIACWSTGCACGLRPLYMPLNKWNNGFAMIDVTQTGGFVVRNYRVVGGKIV